MPEKIAILADSGSDVPAELLNSYDNIEVAPMIVTMDGKEYRDNVDITPEEFYAALDHVDELPKTAAPTQGSVEAQVDKLRQRGFDHIIGITVSAHLSTSFGTFTNVARDDRYSNGRGQHQEHWDWQRTVCGVRRRNNRQRPVI